MQTARIIAPNLDDRRYDDIRHEMIARIPELCPEWTDHNRSDPGITLIELFAGLAEMIIYRLNQVPEKNYMAFLNLLGITRDPPTPATVVLAFTLSKPSVTIPKGTQVSTKPTEREDAIIFETDAQVLLPGNFVLTEQSLQALQSANLPQDALDSLEPMKDQVYLEESKFLDDLKANINEDQFAEYQALILQYSRIRIPARTALTIKGPEDLGRSTGEAFQVFALRHNPLYQDPSSPDRIGHLEIRVDGVIWKQVDTFQKGGSQSYRCNPVTAEILFGEGENIPPKGARIEATRYRYVVGGIRSNVPAHTLTLLRAPVDGVKEVTNPQAASGASDWEPIEQTLRRAPQEIKSIDRAVTAGDYEFLAKEATTDVAKVRCLGPKKKSGSNDEYEQPPDFPLDRRLSKVNLLLAPNIPYAPALEDTKAKDANRKPSSDLLLDEVEAYLNERRVMTSELILKAPAYVEISVEATVFIPAGESLENAVKNVKTRLQSFLHPISGGPDGRGWEIGQDIYVPHIFEAINKIAGVNYVGKLKLRGRREGEEIKEDEGVRIHIKEHELACSAAESDFLITAKPDEGEQ